MKIVQCARGGGKTTYLFNRLAEDFGAVMVEPEEMRTEYTREQYQWFLIDRGLRVDEAQTRARGQIVSCLTITRQRGRHYTRVYVDDVDHVLAVLLHASVAEATFTGEIEYAPLHALNG